MNVRQNVHEDILKLSQDLSAEMGIISVVGALRNQENRNFEYFLTDFIGKSDKVA
jgi:hypothetical protein